MFWSYKRYFLSRKSYTCLPLCPAICNSLLRDAGERDLSSFDCFVFIPSNNRTRRIFVGRSSTLISTIVLHSGHLSSCFVLTISSKHLLQNVCWQGRTLLVWSSISRHTEHSSNSFSDCSSMIWTDLTAIHSRYFYYLLILISTFN